MIRLDRLLVHRHPELTRRRAQRAIEYGQVRVDGSEAREPGRLVDEQVELSWEPNRPRRPYSRLSLPQLYEDEHVIVVNKPAGLLSVPTPGGGEDSVLGRVKEHVTRLRRRGFVRAVHRLDRETSGALALALSPEAAARLIDAFREHRIERRYLAIVAGSPETESGVVDAPIRERYVHGRRGVARPGEAARPAVSRWRIVERLGRAALLEVHLETGRQHQIRSHLAHVGLPVIGDTVYGREAARYGPRPMLHAAVLGFAHPATGNALRVECAPPADFAELLVQLRRRALRGRGRARGARHSASRRKT